MAIHQAYQPRQLKGITLRSAFIKTATYEGMYDDGSLVRLKVLAEQVHAAGACYLNTGSHCRSRYMAIHLH